MSNEKDSKGIDTEKRNVSQNVNVNLYIGVFFDGTNNNKVQSMLALSDRRKKFYKKFKKKLKDLGVNTYEDMFDKARSFFSDNNIGTIAELDSIFGSSYNFDLFIEEKIATDNKSEYRQATSSDNFNESSRNYFKADAGLEYNGKKSSGFFIRGSTSAGSNYTNIAILNSLYETSEDINESHEKDNSQNSINRYYSVYVEGSGANEELNIIKNIINLPKSTIKGLGFGVGKDGFANKCKKATDRIQKIVDSFNSREDISGIYCYFDVFGFSRGATTARSFTHILRPNQDNSINSKNLNLLFTGKSEPFLESSKIKEKKIRTLGLFDTVASIGILREECSYLIGDKVLNIGNEQEFKGSESYFHDTNVTDFGLYSTDKAENVLHICALDEFRKNFALINIDSSINSHNGTEVYIPGCHTDIGGGTKLGLDNPKIINFDEIATKGKILFQLYVRTNGVITVINSVKNISMTIIELSRPELLLIANKNIKQLITQLHSAVSGLFSIFTGYEDLENYHANNGIITPKEKNQKTTSEHSDLYVGVTKCYKNVDSILNTIEKVQPSLINTKSIYDQFWTETTFLSKIQTGADLVQAAKTIVDLFKTLYQKLNAICKDIKELSKNHDFKGFKYEVKVSIEKEIKEWELLKKQIEISRTMVQLIFDGKHEDFFMPLEHRRICMYTGGKPYGNIEIEKIKPICIKTLQDAGWIPDELSSVTKKTFFTGRATKEDIYNAEKKGESLIVDGTKVAFTERQNILIYKYSKPGYSNLPLKAMYEWAEKNKMFAIFPENVYPIPEELNLFYKQLQKAINKQPGNREYCIPINFDIYKKIRSKFLHISMNQQVLDISDNGLVNGPSFKPIKYNSLDKETKILQGNAAKTEENNDFPIGSLIARRIYVGNDHSETAGGKEFKDYPNKTKWLFD